jgi:hypothetical protein
LQGLAWLPLMLLLFDRAMQGGRVVGAAPIGLAVVFALVLLAGHTQTAFISLLGLAAYGPGLLLWRALCRRELRPLATAALLLFAVWVLGLALAAVQLIPTWELTRLSVRAGGLPFKERVSFSLTPFYLSRALLPVYAEPVLPAHIEHVAYVGVAGLALAAVALCGTLRPARGGSCAQRTGAGRRACLLAVLGLFLSLGAYNPLYWVLARFVPGFAHFRVPARWLAVYALGAAALAGWGADALWNRRGRAGWRACLGFAGVLGVLAGWAVVGVRLGEGGAVGWQTIAGWGVGIVLATGLLLLSTRAPRRALAGILMLLLVELFTSGSALPHGRATAPQAFTGLRPAVAHLLAGEREPPARFISMSDITFDPGDLAEIELSYGQDLSSQELYDYVIAVKQKEVLSPNLPLAFGVPGVDGFGGGVLPLARYVTLERLFLPADAVSIDGRLRENLTAIPDGRWLDLFDVRYVLTDKLRDAWLDDVFYDLQFGVRLGRAESAAVAHVPHFEGTALGLVSYLEGGGALEDGSTVGVVEVGFGEGYTRTFVLRAGEHTAEGRYGAGVAHGQAPVGGHFWPGEPEGSDYVTRLRWEGAAAPSTVVVRGGPAVGDLVVRGLSLIDERSVDFQSLVLSDRGRFRLVHSGDVKIYENEGAPRRAFLVHRAVSAGDDEEALAIMNDVGFDPATVLVLDAGEGGTAGGDVAPVGEERVRVVHYSPERVVIEVDGAAPGYLVLADAWYPGWEAEVDGVQAEIRRADVLFRAVEVDAGTHRVTFAFRPPTLRAGMAVSMAAVVLAAVGFAIRIIPPICCAHPVAPLLSKGARGDIMIGEKKKEDS